MDFSFLFRDKIDLLEICFLFKLNLLLKHQLLFHANYLSHEKDAIELVQLGMEVINLPEVNLKLFSLFISNLILNGDQGQAFSTICQQKEQNIFHLAVTKEYSVNQF